MPLGLCKITAQNVWIEITFCKALTKPGIAVLLTNLLHIAYLLSILHDK